MLRRLCGSAEQRHNGRQCMFGWQQGIDGTRGSRMMKYRCAASSISSGAVCRSMSSRSAQKLSAFPARCIGLTASRACTVATSQTWGFRPRVTALGPTLVFYRRPVRVAWSTDDGINKGKPIVCGRIMQLLTPRVLRMMQAIYAGILSHPSRWTSGARWQCSYGLQAGQRVQPTHRSSVVNLIT